MRLEILPLFRTGHKGKQGSENNLCLSVVAEPAVSFESSRTSHTHNDHRKPRRPQGHTYRRIARAGLACVDRRAQRGLVDVCRSAEHEKNSGQSAFLDASLTPVLRDR